ncbi:MAG: hypothetical protein ACI4SV_02105 [Duodenibacillus sp.]
MKIEGAYKESEVWFAVDPVDCRTFPKPRAKVLMKVRREALDTNGMLRAVLGTHEMLCFAYRASADAMTILLPCSVLGPTVPVAMVERYKTTGQKVKEDDDEG